MRVMLLTAAAMLAGCAQVPAEQVSNVDLCRYTLRGGRDAMVAQNEATRRGLDCRTLYPAIIARDQAQAQGLQNAINALPRAAPLPVPQPTYCQSRWIGGTLRTVCD